MKRITGEKNILSLLNEFDDVFPHNREKIDDYNGWAKKINEKGIAVTFDDHDKHIGIAVFYANDIDNKNGYISLIGLKSDYCGKGYGAVFLNNIILEMRKEGMISISLEVDNDNQRALAFYKKHGFEINKDRETTKLLKLTL